MAAAPAARPRAAAQGTKNPRRQGPLAERKPRASPQQPACNAPIVGKSGTGEAWCSGPIQTPRVAVVWGNTARRHCQAARSSESAAACGCVGIASEGGPPAQRPGHVVRVTSEDDDPTRLRQCHLLHEAGVQLPALAVEGAAEAVW